MVFGFGKKPPPPPQNSDGSVNYMSRMDSIDLAGSYQKLADDALTAHYPGGLEAFRQRWVEQPRGAMARAIDAFYEKQYPGAVGSLLGAYFGKMTSEDQIKTVQMVISELKLYERELKNRGVDTDALIDKAFGPPKG